MYTGFVKGPIHLTGLGQMAIAFIVLIIGPTATPMYH